MHKHMYTQRLNPNRQSVMMFVLDISYTPAQQVTGCNRQLSVSDGDHHCVSPQEIYPMWGSFFIPRHRHR